MGTLKDFFTITRHERIGAVAVLMILLATVLAQVIAQRADSSPDAVDSVAVVVFEQRCDSIAASRDSLPSKKKFKKKSTSKKTGTERGHQAPDRGLAPVPGF